ncbi:hypothetical protein, partial [Enterococcus sp. 3H8_DIV0648]|uniref:hypothetical protein n=1 Tax=Enterococcus sp. 3H8_DIV0648 TaxID=1834178 RepID=UPI0015934FB3
VLEHLTDSEKALDEASKYLAPNGEILLTFPNLAHNSVLIDLFNNKLDWRQVYDRENLIDNERQ